MQPIASLIGAVRRSLKLKLILFVVVLLGVTIGVAPWSAIRMQQRQLLLDAEQDLESLQQVLKALIETSMRASDPDQVQRIVEFISGSDEVDLARIFDTSGVIYFSSQPAERGQRLSAAQMEHLRQSGRRLVLTRHAEGPMHTLLQPLFNRPPCFPCHSPRQKVLGILQLDLSMRPVARRIAELRRSALTVTLVTFGVVVVGLWLALALLIDQPLQSLVATMRRAESGALGVRAEVPTADEIGQLSAHFNQMISKLDAAREELKRVHLEQMTRADRLASIGEMAAAIAHEIRNPLTGISGALSVLNRDFPADDKRREVVRQIRLLIERLSRTVEDVLDYSRPSPPHLQSVSLNDVVDRALSLVQSEAKKAGVRLANRDGIASAAAGAGIIVSADPHQLQQILMNLILNAIQASSAGGEVCVRAQYRAEQGAPGQACVEIADNGKGMTSEEVGKAFDPFFSTKAHGTGLGLSITKQIIERHGGSITLHSAPGAGTRAEIRIPAQPLAVPGSLRT